MSEPSPHRRWSELWATFSVADHLRPGAFISEVLLYDKLIVPVPPRELDYGGAPGAAAAASAEWQRWVSNKWDPARQGQLVGILGDRAVQVSWTAERQAEWKAEMARCLDAASRDGYFTTGSILMNFAPALAHAFVAVSSHRSLEELTEETGVRRLAPHQAVEGRALMAVLGQELLMPADPDGDDFRALADAVEVAGDTTYRAKRAALHLWQQRFVRPDGETDAYSIRTAIAEMRDLVADLRRATRRERVWKGLKWVFFFLNLGSKLLPPAAAVGAKAAEVVGSIGDFCVDQRKPGGAGDPEAIVAASLIVDAREQLKLAQ